MSPSIVVQVFLFFLVTAVVASLSGESIANTGDASGEISNLHSTTCNRKCDELQQKHACQGEKLGLLYVSIDLYSAFDNVWSCAPGLQIQSSVSIRAVQKKLFLSEIGDNGLKISGCVRKLLIPSFSSFGSVLAACGAFLVVADVTTGKFNKSSCMLLT